MIAIDKDHAGLVTLTLNRPDKTNALTEQLLAALTDAYADAGRSGAHAVVLTGAGKVFSAGADLDAARAGLATSPAWERLSATIAGLPCLTVAALNGTLAGGAFGMALACDLRIAVPEARFFYPVMKLGFLPQPSDPMRLTALVGPARAAMILMAGQKVTSDQALAWGLVDELVPQSDLMERARALCADACAAEPAHVAAIKRMIRPAADR